MRSLEDMMSLTGKCAVVTGAAGGIGIKIAETIAELGGRLILVDVQSTDWTPVVSHLTSHWPTVDIQCINCDLEQEKERDKLIAQVLGDNDRVHLFVHSAAFVGSQSLVGWVTEFEHQSLETWRRAFEVNLTAAFHLTQGLTQSLKLSGGSVILISSIYGELGPDYSLYDDTAMGNPAAYAASKGGIIQLTRWLSTTLAPDIRVNCLSPGGVERGQNSVFIKRYERRTPLARMANEEDFKGVIALLGTQAGSYITGQNIMVDGGWSVW